jgi:hypothetical protein
MTHRIKIAAVLVVVAESLAAGQGKDAARILDETRKAMGGDTLAAVTALSAEGRILRTGPDGNTRENEFELSLLLPDKFLMRSVMAAMGNMSIYRNSGFNGGQVIEEIDRPPNLQGGNIVIRIGGPGGPMDPEKMTPEQKAAADRLRLQQNKKEFTRLALGMFAASTPAFPVEFSYAGEAEAPEGKADVLDVKGEGEFAARLFVDQKTHLPLMLSWMDKEPLVVTMGPGGPTAGTAGAPAGGGVVMQRIETGGGKPPSREEMEKRLAEFEAKRKELEATRRTVEYRVFYGDYQKVGGVLLPHRFQRSIDGKPTEEMIVDAVKVNAKMDANKFQMSK